MVGGRLAVDFANFPSSPAMPVREISWEALIVFLQAARIVSAERGERLLSLPEADPQTAQAVLSKAARLRKGLQLAFAALAQRERVVREWTGPINEILRITEGHDEMVLQDGTWKLEFMAREGGLEWLLAAVARSAAEIIVEGPAARVRVCANPKCGLLFCDHSRTRQRRWCSMAICGNRHKVASFARRRA